VAIDASPDALVDGAWRARCRRLTNAAFLVESIERLPRELAGIADEVTVHFPWGSLLRGLLAADPAVLAPLATLLKEDGELRLLLSATERDGLAESSPRAFESGASAYAQHGLGLVEARWASTGDLRGARSSWAKRLQVGNLRSAAYARYRRREPLLG
jgi:16S rRNA (adenine(1408)-N(1))-methyltransferase